MELPESMDNCFYFTRRKLGEKGNAVAWVEKPPCPECGKAKMGKPKGDKGKTKIRAKEYVCPACNYTVDKQEFEETLQCNIIYTCPHCGKDGDTQVPYKRKTFKGVKAVVFECGSCGEKLAITKKLANLKK